MFSFLNTCSLFKMNIVNGQFDRFSLEEDKLPCFSVSFFKESSMTFNVGNDLKVINDFGFCQYDRDSIFTYKDIVLRLYNDYQNADVYIQFDENKESYSIGLNAINTLLLAYKYRMISTGNLLMHSAAVVHKDSGILFCGMSGAGKSTQAGLWHNYLNSWALNFDQPCVLMNGDEIVVHGSPWSGKEGCFINSCVPLKAIVFVEQSKDNKAILLSDAEAFSRVYLNNYVYPISDEIEQQFIENVKKLVEKIPVYTLKCDISEDSVRVMYKCLFGDNYEETKRELNMTYKIKDCFEMKKVADDFIVIPRGEMSLDFSAVIVLNESGAFLWEVIKKESTVEEITKALADKYHIDVELARNDAVKFIDKMVENDLVDVKG